MQRFEAEVRRNESEKLIIQQRIIEAENTINFAAGRFPQLVNRQSVDYINFNLRALSAGVPSQLLQNRADIREAERELSATGLDVASARARFYPSLVLSAGVGYNAFNPSYLFSTPESLIYNAAGDLVAPMINRRAIRVITKQPTLGNYKLSTTTSARCWKRYGSHQLPDRRAKLCRSIEIKKQQLQALEASVEAASSLFQNARADYIDVC